MTDEEGKLRSGNYFLRKCLDSNDLFIVHEIYLKLPSTWKNRRQDDISNDTVSSNIRFKIDNNLY